MLKFTGSYDAQFFDENYLIIDLYFEEFPDDLILTLKKENENYFIENFYFKNENNHYTCPACRRLHVDNDNMKCNSNYRLARQIWEFIKSKDDFKTWLSTK